MLSTCFAEQPENNIEKKLVLIFQSVSAVAAESQKVDIPLRCSLKI